MNKRIRKKIEKRTAAARDAIGLNLSATQQLWAALDELKHSAAYLLDAVLTEAQHTAQSLVQELQQQANKLMASLGQPTAARPSGAQPGGYGRSDTLLS